MVRFNGPFDFALRFFAPEGFPLVVELLAARQAELHLGSAIFEVQAQGNQSEAPLLGFAGEPLYLTAVQEELSRARRFVIELIGAQVGADMDIEQKRFAFLNPGETILEIRLPLAQRFHFAANQYEARLINLIYKIIVPRLPVDAN